MRFNEIISFAGKRATVNRPLPHLKISKCFNTLVARGMAIAADPDVRAACPVPRVADF